MFIFFSIFFLLYSAINYYIFIRGWQALAAVPVLKPFYMAVFLIAALSYFISKIFSENLPSYLYDIFLWIGSFWFAYILYLFLAIIFIDLLRLINWQLDFFPLIIKNNYVQTKLIALIVVFVISTVVIFLGYLNTRNIQINTYNLEIKKGKSKLNNLNIVMASDFHMTPLNNGKLLDQIVSKINALNPDIVLLPGDIVDDKASILTHRNIGPAFYNIKSKFGVFASTGNHEFITGINTSAQFITDHGMKLLRDSLVLIDNSFYIAARDDRSITSFTGLKRKPLKEILLDAENGYPVVLLDHTPLQLEEAEQNNIDLQLSGHTHHGQLFPLNLITSMIYEVSWGYLKKGKTQYIVTSGAGTWGPPVRTGSNAEIVNLKIKFID